MTQTWTSLKAHEFGNSPFLAGATFALKTLVENANIDVNKFVQNDFYVDGVWKSKSNSKEEVNIM